ncbi:MAG: guanylate kinase [Candidatus Polarisedimenticolia bacterium]
MSEAALFVVSGPSGAGKSTLIRKLLESVPGLDFSVSYTTRPSRAGEREGVDYHFVDDATFDRMERAGEFLEWAKVHDRRYGTSARLVEKSLASGHDVLLDVDTQGARSVRRLRPQAVLVFVLPPDRKTLVARLKGRRLESSEEADRRLRKALDEMRGGDAYDYLVINDEIEPAFDALRSIVVAHRASLKRQIPAWRRIVADFEPAHRGDKEEGA